MMLVRCITYTRKQVKAMTAFRLGSHDLGVNASRFGSNRLDPTDRFASCCEQHVVGDERHVFKFSRFAELRAQHPFLPTILQQQAPIEIMRARFYPEHDGQQWHALASYLTNT
jgi:hypothetical protein